jgi:hypothetical protein
MSLFFHFILLLYFSFFCFLSLFLLLFISGQIDTDTFFYYLFQDRTILTLSFRFVRQASVMFRFPDGICKYYLFPRRNSAFRIRWSYYYSKIPTGFCFSRLSVFVKLSLLLCVFSYLHCKCFYLMRYTRVQSVTSTPPPPRILHWLSVTVVVFCVLFIVLCLCVCFISCFSHYAFFIWSAWT